MKPPDRPKTDFEKVKVGEFIHGTINDVQYDMEHKFKFKDKETVAQAIRFVFTLDGYEHNHFSRWMRFNVGEKSNLYRKYISELIEGATPDMDFDLDVLKGAKVKTIWKEKNGFQYIDSIWPDGPKTDPNKPIPETEVDPTPPEGDDEETPF